MNEWKTIWNGKTVDISNAESEFAIFRELKKADGFDVAVGDAEAYYRSFYEEWMDFYDKLNELATKKINSVYEVGCGSGVNLFMFKNRGIERLGGLDYSESLIQNAKDVTKCDDIVNKEASQLSEEIKYDLVMAESVFQYFDNLEYAEQVLRKMLNKSTGIVYLGEIHDVQYEEELMEYRKRTIENYDEKYKGLSKLFYSKEWIEFIAGDRNVVYTKKDNREYINSKYCFNCFILAKS